MERLLRPSAAARAAAAEVGPFHSAHRRASHVLGRGSVALVERTARRDRNVEEAAALMQVAPDPRRRFVSVMLVAAGRVLLFELNDEYADGPCWSLPCTIAPAGMQVAPAVTVLSQDTGISLPASRFAFSHVATRTENGPLFACYYRATWTANDGAMPPSVLLPQGAKSHRWCDEREATELPLYAPSDLDAIRLALRSET